MRTALAGVGATGEGDGARHGGEGRAGAPGRGEASAFERRDEFLARINSQTRGVHYGLDENNRLT
jgi:hypothetical protein